MTFQQAISAGFGNYSNFRGLASRSEYWYWVLFTVLVSLIASGLDRVISGWDTNGGFISTLAGLALLLPTLAVAVRRLRDAGYAWGFLFLALIPVLGSIVVIVLLCQPSRFAIAPVPAAKTVA